MDNRAAIKISNMVWQLWIKELVGFTLRHSPLRSNLIGLLLLFKYGKHQANRRLHQLHAKPTCQDFQKTHQPRGMLCLDFNTT